MTKIEELISRLEKAPGANFALDCAIFETTGLPDEWFGSRVEAWFGHGSGVYGCNTADGKRHLDCLRAPNYTSSIDAALTLIKDGWFYSIVKEHQDFLPADETKLFSAEVRAPVVWGQDPETKMPDPFIETYTGEAHNPAIALCIAALKSRAAMGEK